MVYCAAGVVNLGRGAVLENDFFYDSRHLGSQVFFYLALDSVDCIPAAAGPALSAVLLLLAGQSSGVE